MIDRDTGRLFERVHCGAARDRNERIDIHDGWATVEIDLSEVRAIGTTKAKLADWSTLTEISFSPNIPAELKTAEEELRAVLALADGAAEGDLARLTAVYESMKPKDAIPLFEKMAPEFAAGFLGRMRPDAAGAILSGLPPDSAYSISAILAGRNATAPQD